MVVLGNKVSSDIALTKWWKSSVLEFRIELVIRCVVILGRSESVLIEC